MAVPQFPRHRRPLAWAGPSAAPACRLFGRAGNEVGPFRRGVGTLAPVSPKTPRGQVEMRGQRATSGAARGFAARLWSGERPSLMICLPRRIGPSNRRSAMPKMKDAAGEFLANKRVAVTGVSRKGQSHGLM